jgi:predicted transglutaminase-like cysteine proteinase
MAKYSYLAKEKRTAKAVHALLMKNFTYVTDEKQYGEIEHWVMPPPSFTGHQALIGDCEDFSLAARKLLRDKNIRSRLVACLDETGAGHLILEVNGWIIDNRQRKLCTNRELQRKGYIYQAISGYNAGEPWHRLIPLVA